LVNFFLSRRSKDANFNAIHGIQQAKKTHESQPTFRNIQEQVLAHSPSNILFCLFSI
jgi:hypothetical protein